MAEQSLHYGDATDLSPLYGGVMKALYRQQEIASKKEQDIQAQRKAQNKQVDTLIEKINPDGIRPVDIKILSKKMSEIRDINHLMQTTTSDLDRMKYAAEIRGKLDDTKMFIGRSKQISKQIENILVDQRRNPYMYSGDVRAYTSNLLNLPTDNVTDQMLSAESIKRTIDGSKMNKRLNTIADDLVKVADYGALQRVASKSGNRTGVDTYQEKTVPEEAYLTSLVQEYQGSEEFKAFIAQTYPDTDPREALVDIARTKAAEGRLSHRTETKFIANHIPRASSSKSKNPLGEGNENLHYDIDLPFGDNKVMTTGRFVPIRGVDVELAKETVIDLNTGRPTIMSGKLDATTIVDIPIVKATGEVADKDFAQRQPDLVEMRQFVKGTLEYKGRGSLNPFETETYKKEVLAPKINFSRNMPNTKATNAILDAFDAAPMKKGGSSGTAGAVKGLPKGGF